jgi:uncharacterized protein (DUF1697 family)
MKRYAILLRGINVGVQNRMSMADLKVCLTSLGFNNVASYINSGNIILESDKSPEEIKTQIESALPEAFELKGGEPIKVLVLSHDDIQEVIDNKPKGFGEEPDVYHSDIIFMIEGKVADAMSAFSPKEGVDRVWPGTIVIYSQRLSAMRTKSRLNRIMSTPYYKDMTIRTYGTSMKLLQLLVA